MTILPLTCLGNTLWFRTLLTEECTVDAGEHFRKRSHRNRFDILTPQGPMTLTAQVAHGDRPGVSMREVRLDYSKRWQHRHWQALRSAYAASPYFEHYVDYFAPFFERRCEFLFDWNVGLLDTVLGLLGAPAPRISERYLTAGPSDRDLRGAFPLRGAPQPPATPPYWQVFSDRLPFAPNLSVVDLLFCEGSGALELLTRAPR